jgi:enoyl-CoA hydratase
MPEGTNDTSRVTREERGHVFLMGLNRPEKLNAFDLQMLRELAEAYSYYEANPDLRCALLFAHGANFTSGLDLAEVGPAVAEGGSLWPEGEVDPMQISGVARTKPLVLAAQGWCLTIGTELALASDIRLAATGTRFGQIEIKRGIFPFGGATLRLPLVAGWGNAMRYLLTGDIFEAEEAYRIGLIQEVVDEEVLFERALTLAERVAAQAPLAAQAILVNARLAIEDSFQAASRELIPEAQRLMVTKDAQEGMRSFVERREARFEGH